MRALLFLLLFCAPAFGAFTNAPVKFDNITVTGNVGAASITLGGDRRTSWPDGSVTSVNGQTGAVNVAVPVLSVNNQTGAVTIATQIINLLAGSNVVIVISGTNYTLNVPSFPWAALTGVPSFDAAGTAAAQMNNLSNTVFNFGFLTTINSNAFDLAGMALTQQQNLSNSVFSTGFLTAQSNINAVTFGGQVIGYFAASNWTALQIGNATGAVSAWADTKFIPMGGTNAWLTFIISGAEGSEIYSTRWAATNALALSFMPYADFATDPSGNTLYVTFTRTAAENDQNFWRFGDIGFGDTLTSRGIVNSANAYILEFDDNGIARFPSGVTNIPLTALTQMPLTNIAVTAGSVAITNDTATITMPSQWYYTGVVITNVVTNTLMTIGPSAPVTNGGWGFESVISVRNVGENGSGRVGGHVNGQTNYVDYSWAGFEGWNGGGGAQNSGATGMTNYFCYESGGLNATSCTFFLTVKIRPDPGLGLIKIDTECVMVRGDAGTPGTLKNMTAVINGAFLSGSVFSNLTIGAMNNGIAYLTKRFSSNTVTTPCYFREMRLPPMTIP